MDKIMSRFRMDLQKGYLEMPLKKEEAVISYQYEMLIRNPSVNLVPVEKYQHDLETALRYRLPTRGTLAGYLGKTKLQTDESLEILELIARIVMESRKLLLSPHNFILDPSWIFYQQANANPALIYLPIRIQADYLQSACFQFNGLPGMKEFVESLMYTTAPFSREVDNWRKIIEYLERESFNPGGFWKLIREQRLPRPAESEPAPAKAFQLLPEGTGGERPENAATGAGSLNIGGLRLAWDKARVRGIAVFALLQGVFLLFLLCISPLLRSLVNSGLIYGVVGLFLLIGDLVFLHKFVWPDLVSGKVDKCDGDPLARALIKEYGVLRREKERVKKSAVAGVSCSNPAKLLKDGEDQE